MSSRRSERRTNNWGAPFIGRAPLDGRARELVKLALAIGARYEGAVHVHTRLALAAGATPSDIKHVVALAVTTLGMPTAGAAYTWVNDILTEHEAGS